MADNMNGSRTKADLIVEKIGSLNGEIASVEKRVNGLVSALDENKAMIKANSKATADGVEQLKVEINYVSAQLESVCVMLSRSVKKLADEVEELKAKQQPDLDELASRIAAKIVIPEADGAVAEKLDYDALGYAVAKSIYVPQAIAEEIDYEELSSKIAEKMPAPEYVAPTPEAVQAEVDYDLIAAKVAEAVNVEPVSADRIAALVAEQIVVPTAQVDVAEIEVDELAAMISDKIAVPQASEVNVEELASMVSDRITVPAASEINVEELASMVSDKIAVPQAEAIPYAAEQVYQPVEIDTNTLADEVVNRLATAISEALNPEDIADCIAKKVGSVSPEDFEITVDDDGCDSIAKAIESKLDYDELAAKVSEKIAPAYTGMSMAEGLDAEEIASAISEKLTVNAAVDEDALAEKAASILSNYMPEVDSADIADKVIAGIIPAIPAAATIDSEAIADEVSAKVLENQSDNDYEIVIDEEGIAQITDSMKGELTKVTEEHYEKVEGDLTSVKEDYTARLDKVDSDIEEIKKLLAADLVIDSASIADEVSAKVLGNQSDDDYEIVIDEEGVAQISEKVKGELTKVTEEHYEKVESDLTAVKEEYTARFDKVDEDIEEIKKLLAAGAIVVAAASNDETAVAEDELVTVSDVVGEEQVEETVVADEVIEEIVSDIEEAPAEGEILPDGMDEESEGGVDFANMMKYNRSFIARIIQGTDDQKNYYGQVKTALLSYKKVNSNIAWGAERFNKGRETIARFKIRGKTLCLYLALDPAEFETSVYHHVDVSDNKSMHGTPMMVKIKSARGVKKAIRLIDIMLERREGIKRPVAERDYAAMYPYETIEELIEDGLVKDVSKK